MKKLVSILFAAALALSFASPAFAYENLVDDSANLFSREEIAEISTQAELYSGETGLSLAVVTTDDTQGRTTENFAEDYYDDLADYQGWSENGMILLIDMDNRIVFTTAVGDTWEFYSNSDISYITDCGYDEALSGQYGSAILAMIDAALETYGSNDGNYEGGYYYDDDYYYDDYNYNDYGSYNNYHGSLSISFIDILIYILIGLAVGALSVFAVKSKYKNQGKGDEFDTDDLILYLTGSNDTVISRNVVTAKIPKNNNHGRPGGSHGGGGASVHHSSGGRTHRSSGRKF